MLLLYVDHVLTKPFAVLTAIRITLSWLTAAQVIFALGLLTHICFARARRVAAAFLAAPLLFRVAAAFLPAARRLRVTAALRAAALRLRVAAAFFAGDDCIVIMAPLSGRKGGSLQELQRLGPDRATTQVRI